MEKVNDILDTKNIKEKKVHKYLFSKLIKDTNCSKFLVGAYSYGTKFYRCNIHVKNRTCCSSKTVNEKKLESFLLKNLDKYLKEYYSKIELEYKQYVTNEKDNKEKLALLKEEKARITISFTKGWISEEEADKEHEKIDKEIEKLSSIKAKKSLSHLKSLDIPNWQELYLALDYDNKIIFWRNIIDYIELNPNNYMKNQEEIKIVFL